MSVSTRLNAGLMLLSLVISACGRATSPEQAASMLLTNLEAGRGDKVWEGLSERSRSELIRRSEARGDKFENTPGKAARLVFEVGELTLVRSPKSFKVLEAGITRAVLQIEVEGGAPAQLVMVSEGGRWKLDLFGSMTDFPDYGVGVGTSSAAGTSTRGSQAR
ncbi:MAG: hypothetical protein HY791_00515 [Deltaproteobacteria bacterium]|nr:hypothetical protein [Deltaproteobacteria bacterium]